MEKGAQGGASRIRHPRYLLFVGLLAAGVWPFLQFLPLGEAVVASFDLAVTGFTLSFMPLWLRGDPAVIRDQAKRDDAGQVLLLLITALLCGVIFVTLLELKVHGGGPLGIALIVVTLAAAWLFANLVMALHYARLFYSDAEGKDHGGLEFPGRALPDFSDFVNFAFVIGMTCQTADIGISSRRIRRLATFHGLFAFVFNLGILALTVNILAARG